MTRIISVIALCLCLCSCAEFYLSNKRYRDKYENEIVLTDIYPNVFDHLDEIITSPCLKLPKAYYFEKNKYFINGCWHYTNEKIVFIGFDNTTRIFTPQWTIQNLAKN